MNREFVLKNFFNKSKEAKRQGVKDIKLSLIEMEDLNQCLCELLSEYFSKTIIDFKSKKVDNDDTEYSMDGGKFKN